jgi:hypothetical protein
MNPVNRTELSQLQAIFAPGTPVSPQSLFQLEDPDNPGQVHTLSGTPAAVRAMERLVRIRFQNGFELGRTNWKGDPMILRQAPAAPAIAV